MIDKFLKYQQDRNIDLKVRIDGRKVILEDTSFINLPCHRSYLSFDDLMDDVDKLLGGMSDGIHYLFGVKKQDKEDESISDNVIELKKKEFNPYADHGYRLAESPPGDMERAVLCINNIMKPRCDQDPEFIDLHDGISFIQK